MKHTLLALLAFAPCACAVTAAPTDPTPTDDSNLVGGTVAGDADIPSALVIQSNCTASRVGPRHILLAAHCVTDASRRPATVIAAAFEPGQKIHLSRERVVHNVGDAPTKFVEVEVESVTPHPSWVEDCMARGDECMQAQEGPSSPADVAIIRTRDELPIGKIASVDLRPVRTGEKLLISGYGCEKGYIDATTDPHTYDTQKLRMERTFALPASAMFHEGSFFSRSPELETRLTGTLVVTPGNKMDPRHASLCPGDSGGPLFRDTAGQDVIVGVNATYTFLGDARDPAYVAYTNGHTRLDRDAQKGVGAWLAGLGVRTTTTREPSALAGTIACPAGFSRRPVSKLGGWVCVDSAHDRLSGPFTTAVREQCAALAKGNDTSVCDGDTMPVALGLEARGTAVCPRGAALDVTVGYCVEGASALGPFAPSVVADCARTAEPSACTAERVPVTALHAPAKKGG